MGLKKQITSPCRPRVRGFAFMLWLFLMPFAGCDSGPQIPWTKFDETSLEQSLQSSKPTLVYFYAAWCGPCRQMRAATLGDPEVISALGEWNTLKADMSFRENEQTIAWNRQYEVWALPMFVFYDKIGFKRLKQAGYISKRDFLEMIAQTESL